MTDFLDRVVAERRADAAELRAALPRAATSRRMTGLDAFTAALLERRTKHRLAVIAEVKRRSPALGALGHDADVVALAARYEAAGAAAISVLTEPRHWGGSLEDLRAVRRAVRIPVLRKDVIVDAVQLREAADAGADAVLLIAEALDDEALRSLVDEARALGLGALVEAHEPAAFARAVAAGSSIVGVNARNLRRPEEIDRGRVGALQGLARADQILVAESGIGSVEDAKALPARVDAVLVGTALMRAADPGPLIAGLAAIVRDAVATR